MGKKELNESYVDGMLLNHGSRIRVVPRQSNEITIFIDDNIVDPHEYRDEFHTIINAGEYDEINIVLNTGGGNLSTANMLVQAMHASRAEINCILVGDCYSAGTIIALNAKNVVVLDSATFMVHTASFASGGTTNNIKGHVDFTHQYINRLIDETYEGFLTKIELEQVKNGKEFWFTAEEVKNRLVERTKYFEIKAKKEEKESKVKAKSQKKPQPETTNEE